MRRVSCLSPANPHLALWSSVFRQIAAVLLQPKLIPIEQVREALQLRTTYLQHRGQYAQQAHGSAVVARSGRMYGNGINHGMDADRVEMEDGVRTSGNNNSSETPPSTDLTQILIDHISELDTQAAVFHDGDRLCL